jgi:hypothetical protein
MYEVHGGASLIIVQCALVRVSYPGLERSLPNDKVEREREREREREIIRQMCGKKCMRCDQIAEVCEVGTDFFLLL